MEKLRLLVLADLPSDTRHERKIAREFGEMLFRDGFVLLQEKVYTRVADGRKNADLHKKRLQSAKPDTGTVRLIVLTERQFQEASMVAGSPDAQEQEVGSTLDVFL